MTPTATDQVAAPAEVKTRVGFRCCNEVRRVRSKAPLSPEELAKIPCPECGRQGWLIAMPIAGTWPSEVAPIDVVFFEKTEPYWWECPGPLPPPLGVVIVADMISRHGGTERDGWAVIMCCGTCRSNVITPFGTEPPTVCECGASLVNWTTLPARPSLDEKGGQS